jgi:hypothetical protein
MSEYRLVLPKTVQGGFAESPQQDIGNAGSPNLTAPLTAKNAIGIGVAAMYGKKVATVGFNAIVGQLGNSRLEKSIEIGSKLAGYGAMAIVNPLLAIGAAGVDVITSGITNAVDAHSIQLENQRLIDTRGTRVKFGAGGYYG